MGRDKALLEVGGDVLWRRQVRLLEGVVNAGVGVAGSVEGPWGREGYEVVADWRAGIGPAGGVAGGLRWAGSGHLLVLAVDLPLMSAGFLRRLLGFRREGLGVVGVLDGGREPLAAVYPVEALGAVVGELEAGRFSLRGFWECWAGLGGCVDVPVWESEREVFLNLNHPVDLGVLGDAGG